ncbi:MAG: GTP-binding protein [Desulfobacteraceae bacterium 4572_123]|nr:MAG: GTP-binding protein [Desulfobacteraceae bacterium 4572_123]
MSIPQEPRAAKLVVGLLMKDKELFGPLAEALSKKLGLPDIVSAWFDFDYTGYYEQEMGGPLFRRMLAFKTLIPQDDLAGIKLITNAIEQDFQQNGNRRANIDPGYLLSERFVLATGKNFAHRIYIGRNIYADLTLIYRNGAFQTLPWTYPDYADSSMLTFLGRVRNKYVLDKKTPAHRSIVS